MWNVVRIACGFAALAGAFLLVRRIAGEREAFAEWRRELPANEVSQFAPLEVTIADLYRAPPPPGRRVALTGRVHVRDTLFTERPILQLDSVVRQPEALIFLADSTTGERLVVLRRLDVQGSSWVELMPLPRDVGAGEGVARWTPLAHLKDLWMPGWANANGPGGLVWLGLDSAVVRYRDLVGPAADPPYRLRARVMAGEPGGRARPEVPSIATLVLGGCVMVLAVIALFGGSVAPHRS